jgi:hypothetical protein
MDVANIIRNTINTIPKDDLSADNSIVVKTIKNFKPDVSNEKTENDTKREHYYTLFYSRLG